MPHSTRCRALSGSGSVAARRAALTALLARATESEQAFLRALILGDLRQGALAAVVGDAVAKAADVPVAAVRRALMLRGDLGRGRGRRARRRRRRRWPRSGSRSGARSRRCSPRRRRIWRPRWRRPARPRSSGSSTARGSRSTGPGRPWGSSRARSTTSPRGCRRSSRRRCRCRRSSFVLDGEAIALREDGRPHPFQVTGSRFASALGAHRAADADVLRSAAPRRDGPARPAGRRSAPRPCRRSCRRSGACRAVGPSCSSRRWRWVTRASSSKALDGAVRGGPARRRLGQGQARPHARSGRAGRRVGLGPAARMALQPAPRRPRGRTAGS